MLNFSDLLLFLLEEIDIQFFGKMELNVLIGCITVSGVLSFSVTNL